MTYKSTDCVISSSNIKDVKMYETALKEGDPIFIDGIEDETGRFWSIFECSCYADFLSAIHIMSGGMLAHGNNEAFYWGIYKQQKCSYYAMSSVRKYSNGSFIGNDVLMIDFDNLKNLLSKE